MKLKYNHFLVVLAFIPLGRLYIQKYDVSKHAMDTSEPEETYEAKFHINKGEFDNNTQFVY